MGITAIPRTAFRAFVTVVAALFQELGVYCHAIIAMHCISSICDCYSRNMDISCRYHALPSCCTAILLHCHPAALPSCCISAFSFGTVATTLGNGHPLPSFGISTGGYSNSKKWASSTMMPPAEVPVVTSRDATS